MKILKVFTNQYPPRQDLCGFLAGTAKKALCNSKNQRKGCIIYSLIDWKISNDRILFIPLNKTAIAKAEA